MKTNVMVPNAHPRDNAALFPLDMTSSSFFSLVLVIGCLSKHAHLEDGPKGSIQASLVPAFLMPRKKTFVID
jgi:hypothetical protein